MFFRRKKRGGTDTDKASEPGIGSGTEAPAVDADTSRGLRRSPPSTQFLTGEAGKDRRTVQVLLETIARISVSRDLDSLLPYIVDTSIAMTGAERGLLIMRGEDDSQNVRVARLKGGKPVEEELRYSTSIAGKVLKEVQPVRATVHSESEMLELGKSVYDLRLRAVMCVPLTPPEDEDSTDVRPGHAPVRPAGVLYVDSRAATRQFTHEELAAFAALAQQISIAMQNARGQRDSIDKARLEEEQKNAAAIQRALMPKSEVVIPGWDVHPWYEPAEGAAGDFYDFVNTKDGGVAVVVGDVTGHGIGPALITQTAQASLRTSLRLVSDLGEVVTLLNQDLSERVEDGRFLTLFLARLCADGSVHGLNAGHESPLVWRRDGDAIEQIDGGGPALGMIPGETFTAHPALVLADGDVFVIYSDGLTEARAAGDPNTFFGQEGVRRALSEAAQAGKDAEGICRHLVAEAMQFSKNAREDDITLVVARRRDGSA